MIKNKLLFLCFLLTACETAPYKLSNMYYEIAYITTKSTNNYENDTAISFDSIGTPFTLMGKDLPQKLEIYLDDAKQCLLFSYSYKDLYQMTSIIDDNHLFVITKDGLEFISYNQLKKIKKYSVPHKFDLSLCR